MIEHWLVSTTPGQSARFRLQPPGPLRVGRSAGNEILLDDRTISRNHAVLEWIPPGEGAEGRWRLINTSTTGATAVNNVRMSAGIGLTLAPGDLLRVGPWKLRLVAIEPGATLADLDEGLEGSFEAVTAADPTTFAQHQLLLLLKAGELIHRAESEEDVRNALVGAVAQATGFENVAFLRAVGDGNAEVLASAGGAQPRYSRSMLRKAHAGPVVVTDLQQEIGSSMGASLQRMAVQQAICIPLEVAGSNLGFLYLDSSQKRDPSMLFEGASIASALVRMAAQMLGNLQRSSMEHRFAVEQQLMFAGTVHALINAIDAKDPYTRGHSDRVAAFARLLAEAAKLSDDMVARSYLCGTVHDLGKIGVPEAVLCKPGRLTDEEFALIKAHPEIGHRILRDIPHLQEVLPGVLEHHEKWDGSGYPNRLKGEAISLLGRVVCIADCFDAMTSARVYRPGRPVAEVLAEIERCAGTHFDPELAKAFAGIPLERLMQHVASADPADARKDGPPA
jgi:HD-GYP domain-containing protein (c-di-GMP phosphodiesterase class II)